MAEKQESKRHKLAAWVARRRQSWRKAGEMGSRAGAARRDDATRAEQNHPHRGDTGAGLGGY
jgi:hypothetical protein